MTGHVLHSVPWILGITLLFQVDVEHAFSSGSPDNSCKDPSTFHTRKLNATHEGIILPQGNSNNPFRLIVRDTHFTPGQEITVTLETTDTNVLLEGFFIQAIKANIDIRDLSREPYGVFKNTTSRVRPSPCQSRDASQRGGITHTDAVPRRRVDVVWVAPPEDPGNVQFLATGVQKYDVYWTDIRSNVLQSSGYATKQTGNARQRETILSPTAVWYIWLHNLRHLGADVVNSQKPSNPAT